MWQTAPLNRDFNGESKYKFSDPAHVITGQTRFAEISLKTTVSWQNQMKLSS